MRMCLFLLYYRQHVPELRIYALPNFRLNQVGNSLYIHYQFDLQYIGLQFYMKHSDNYQYVA